MIKHMKEVYLLRHAEKDTTNMLTERGMLEAEAMRSKLPRFTSVISSPRDRAILTAKLLTGQEPQIDERADYATATPEVSAIINAMASDRRISFWDAAREYNDPEVLRGIDEQAHRLNEMIDELLDMAEDGTALVVSHDLTIAPAVGFRGMTAESIMPLGGYVISAGAGLPLVRRYE
jgi:broad specificity phosphatase PhoE